MKHLCWELSVHETILQLRPYLDIYDAIKFNVNCAIKQFYLSQIKLLKRNFIKVTLVSKLCTHFV